MGLLVLAGIAALVLTALALVTTLIVQLVLWLSVRNTLLIVGVLAVYGFIDSRRRQVAKGFYSCKELAITSGTTTTSTTTTPAVVSTPAPVAATTPTHSEPANDAQPAQPQETESTVVADTKPPHVTRQRSFSENATSSATAFPPSHSSDADDGATADSTSADVMRHSMSDADADLASFKPPPSTQLLPELRRKKWTKPSHSLPLKHKGESLLLRRSTSSATSGATSSPRRPELYGSPRSVAIEQKLMSNALESDGYFIGDFRLPPPPLVRRTHSTGTATPPRSASPALQDRTGPRAV